ncbi:ribokinase [Rathayibacter sp. YIM 133350]|uniref:ribokinase n=1 Tax=Rathayibacter sp. YIM 133350 TaxID=3131992 RepID=UPI00307E032E
MQERTRGRVVVVGSVNIDLVVGVEAIVAPGQTVIGGDLSRLHGGKGANQAVAAARAGAQTVLIARVGDDEFADAALENLRGEGVDTAFVRRSSSQSTGVALIQVADGGENAIVVASGANGDLSRSDVDDAFAAIEGEAVVVLGFETPLEVAEHAAGAARARGWRVLLNPAPARILPATLLADVDVILPNEHEITRLGFDSPADLIEAGIPTIVETRGADGVRVHTASGSRHVPAVRVTAIDTTGAGDAFVGSLAAALAEGDDLDAAIVRAVRAGAEVTTRIGAR